VVYDLLEPCVNTLSTIQTSHAFTSARLRAKALLAVAES